MFWKALPLVAALAGTAVAVTTILPEDHESLPPSAAELFKSAELATPLERAVAVAAQDTGGRAFGARLDNGTWLVDVATAAKRFEVAVSAEGGVASKREVPRFPGMPATGEIAELSDGIQYYVLQEGTGAKPAGPASEVKVHYAGYLTNGTEFDSSYKRGEPATFPLNRVIRGWTVGVGDMKVGEKRKLIIPYAAAYGPNGRGPTIPPKATLIFDVELIEVVGE